MALYKSVNGISIKLSDEEETALIAERAENIKHQIQSIEDKSQAKGKDND